MVMQHPLVDCYIKVYILRRSRCKLNAKKMLAHDVTLRTMARKILKKINGLVTDQINSVNFNATTMKLAKKFNDPFSLLKMLQY